jgi:hypothetical protein
MSNAQRAALKAVPFTLSALLNHVSTVKFPFTTLQVVRVTEGGLGSI